MTDHEAKQYDEGRLHRFVLAKGMQLQFIVDDESGGECFANRGLAAIEALRHLGYSLELIIGEEVQA
jgi:arylamine N-acetyltransferase